MVMADTWCHKLENMTEKPIIFLCHSLGGLVVKRVRYQTYEDHTNTDDYRHCRIPIQEVLIRLLTCIQYSLARMGYSSSAHLTTAPQKRACF